MDEKHPLQELANDPGLAEAMQDAMRLAGALWARFDEMITALRAITGQSETDAIRDLENAMGALIVRQMQGE